MHIKKDSVFYYLSGDLVIEENRYWEFKIKDIIPSTNGEVFFAKLLTENAQGVLGEALVFVAPHFENVKFSDERRSFPARVISYSGKIPDYFEYTIGKIIDRGTVFFQESDAKELLSIE